MILPFDLGSMLDNRDYSDFNSNNDDILLQGICFRSPPTLISSLQRLANVLSTCTRRPCTGSWSNDSLALCYRQ